MNERKVQNEQRSSVRILRDYRPISALWEGDDPAYPSEQSTRWALRQLRGELVKADAIAFHHGRILVHPERFARVAEARALQEARKRFGR